MIVKIGKNIALLRKRKGLTQDELAKVLSVSNQAVSKWEAEKCCPDIELLPELAGFFEVSIDELLVGECLTKSKLISQTTDSIVLQAIKIAQEEQKISTSILQRKLKIGYCKAKKIVDDMHEGGYIIKDTTCSYRYLYNSNPNNQSNF